MTRHGELVLSSRDERRRTHRATRRSVSRTTADHRLLPYDAPFRWIVTPDSLPVLSEICPRLPNASVEIQGDVPLEAISERISSFMRLNSIQCNYDTERGRVIASTTNVHKFVVQLWRRRNADTSSSSDIIVVEVRRRLGCSIGMHRIKKSLVRSIKTGDYHIERHHH
jgi:hypothetical protein